MIIRDFDVLRTIRSPDKTYPELVIDSNTVLTSPITLQNLRFVPRRNPQRMEGNDSI